MYEKLGENLSILMDRIRITANDLAKATGIPMSTLKKIRTQVNTNPTLSTLLPIAHFFSVSLDQLVAGNVVEPNRQSASLLPIVSQALILNREPIYRANAICVVSEYDFSADAFALRIETQEWDIFPLHSLLLVEPNKLPQHRDFVLLEHVEKQQLTLKQIIYEDELAWLRSVNIAENTIALSDKFIIVGVIVESRKQLSAIHNNTTKHKLKFRETIL